MHEELRLMCIDVQTFYPWASLTTRLWKGSEHLEVEWTIGPIPFKDGLGREISVQPSAFMWLFLSFTASRFLPLPNTQWGT